MSSTWSNAPKNTEVVFRHLKKLAAQMRTATYGEVAEAIGSAEKRVIAPISLSQPLAFIRDEICRPRGLPWLYGIVVNANSWLPGDSFLPEGVALGDDQRVLWRGAVLAVFAYPWGTVRLEEQP
jgi:hypothetical protein